MDATNQDTLETGRYRYSMYAGFWSRFVAMVLDFYIVELCLFPLFLIAGFLIPNQVHVSVPFGLFSPETTVEFSKDGSQIVREEVLGRWTYFYRIEPTFDGDKEVDETRMLIDFESGDSLDLLGSDDVLFLVLLLYWAFMESSRHRASLGKMALGIVVTDRYGNRLSFARAFGRNFSKFLSVITFLIGFMLAGWTKKKQALHDIVSGCLVIEK